MWSRTIINYWKWRGIMHVQNMGFFLPALWKGLWDRTWDNDTWWNAVKLEILQQILKQKLGFKYYRYWSFTVKRGRFELQFAEMSLLLYWGSSYAFSFWTTLSFIESSPNFLKNTGEFYESPPHIKKKKSCLFQTFQGCYYFQVPKCWRLWIWVLV